MTSYSEGTSDPGGAANYNAGSTRAGTSASTVLPPSYKNQLNILGSLRTLRDTKLIRTNTINDLSQKAEKRY